MAALTVYDYSDYKAYLRAFVGQAGKGIRGKLAEALGCQPAFVSQVLHEDKVQLSLEHGMRANRFLGHTEDESHYFMLLLNLGKAGSREVRRYFEAQLARIREQRKRIDERIQVKKKLDPEDQSRYYSSWHYTAIHALLATPSTQTVDALATRLKISPQVVSDCLSFLVSRGLVERKGSRYVPTTTRTHLAKGSPMLAKHHANWRMKAIQSLDDPATEDLHFSGPISIAENDVETLRSMCLGFLENAEKIIGPAKEETVYCLAIDFFRV